MENLKAQYKEELAVVRHEMAIMDTESSSLATSLDEEALSLRKQLSEVLAEKDQTQDKHQTELLELRDEFKQITEQLGALQQVSLSLLKLPISWAGLAEPKISDFNILQVMVPHP